MERRTVMKGMALAAGAGAAVAAGQVATSTTANAQRRGVGIKDITPVEADYIIPGRFTGKTLVVTGCARGMGAAAAIRAAKEGANVVGVDWIQDLGAATIEKIRAAGGKATFIHGDITETAICERMVKT
ncbi:MAG: SDR family NAD(P)-dependent oxidoreductase, partial [Bosea sp. (in: a-proteobacteria)]